MNFSLDLQKGEEVEREILALIRKLYPHARKMPITSKLGDLFVPELELIIEVKFDRMCESTKRLAFEYSYKGEPSGLATTKSKAWVEVTNSKIYLFETARLKDTLRTSFKDLDKVSGGDGKASKMLFLPLESAKSMATVLNRKDPDEVFLKSFLMVASGAIR